MSCITLHCFLGKVFVQTESQLGEYPMKNTQNRFKIIATLTFEDLWNENQNCCLQETYYYVTL